METKTKFNHFLWLVEIGWCGESKVKSTWISSWVPIIILPYNALFSMEVIVICFCLFLLYPTMSGYIFSLLPVHLQGNGWIFMTCLLWETTTAALAFLQAYLGTSCVLLMVYASKTWILRIRYELQFFSTNYKFVFNE